ncbi:GrdX family protein [Desulfovibrio sp. OttesenSCG-928-G15]|nr:GrdX family protein [Desulfovibrio sp. OttesenSCG-928-G15]
MNSDLLVLSNNPLVWDHAGKACHRVEGPALSVLYECLKLIAAAGYVLYTHPAAGNARLAHNPFRTLIVKRATASAEQQQRDSACLEYFLEKLEALGGDVPPDTVEDYRSVDYGLFLGMLPGDTLQ